MILCFYRQEVETFKEKHKIIDVPYSLPKKKRNQTNVRNQCMGEPYVRPLTETEIKLHLTLLVVISTLFPTLKNPHVFYLKV